MFFFWFHCPADDSPSCIQLPDLPVTKQLRQIFSRYTLSVIPSQQLAVTAGKKCIGPSKISRHILYPQRSSLCFVREWTPAPWKTTPFAAEAETSGRNGSSFSSVRLFLSFFFLRPQQQLTLTSSWPKLHRMNDRFGNRPCRPNRATSTCTVWRDLDVLDLTYLPLSWAGTFSKSVFCMAFVFVRFDNGWLLCRKVMQGFYLFR